MQKISKNPSRRNLLRFAEEASKGLEPGALVLDAGAGDQAYKRFFTQATYESADFCKVEKAYDDPTYVCDLRAIPVGDARYDRVLMTQVLEHLPEPAAVLDEMNRVLKPGCELWLSAPLFYPEHEQPYDFYRYTQFGFRHLLENAAFEVTKIDWLEGYYATLAFQLRYAAQQLPSGSRAYGGSLLGAVVSLFTSMLKLPFRCLAALFDWLERRNLYQDGGHPKNYIVVARKK